MWRNNIRTTSLAPISGDAHAVTYCISFLMPCGSILSMHFTHQLSPYQLTYSLQNQGADRHQAWKDGQTALYEFADSAAFFFFKSNLLRDRTELKTNLAKVLKKKKKTSRASLSSWAPTSLILLHLSSLLFCPAVLFSLISSTCFIDRKGGSASSNLPLN